jgi:protein O-GlcNAc transferase
MLRNLVIDLFRKRTVVVASPAASDSRVSRLLVDADSARNKGDLSEAIRIYGDAAASAPDNQYAHYWLATCYEQIGDYASGRRHCAAGLAINPEQIGLLLRMASIAHRELDHRLALDCYLKAAALDPDVPEIDAMIADQYCFVGNIAKGVAHFDRALLREPGSSRLQSNRLFVLNYAQLLTPAQLYAEHRRWGEAHENALRGHWRPHANSLVADRKLRIGYVSGDLRDHAVSFFVAPILTHHDRQQFDIVCFDTSHYPEDDVTARLKAHGHGWHRIADLSDDALASAIRAEGIDILVDLSGHTAMNRLLTFARKPAPVQATWLGYLNTTGLTSMDYRLTDAYLDPPGTTERYHTEALYRLPNAACFAPPSTSPQIRTRDDQAQRGVVFGSVNQWSKVSDAVRGAWCEILRDVPDARLIVVARGAQNPAFAADIQAAFAGRDVDPLRISVRPATSLAEFLELLQEIDVALDPFPYGGGTTTMHCLWMGVPVITLAGETAMARNSVGPLLETGLEGLVAGGRVEYVRIGARLARSPVALAASRSGLRQRVCGTMLVDQAAFTHHLEVAYRRIWRTYCETGSPQNSSRSSKTKGDGFPSPFLSDAKTNGKSPEDTSQ